MGSVWAPGAISELTFFDSNVFIILFLLCLIVQFASLIMRSGMFFLNTWAGRFVGIAKTYNKERGVFELIPFDPNVPRSQQFVRKEHRDALLSYMNSHKKYGESL